MRKKLNATRELFKEIQDELPPGSEVMIRTDGLRIMVMIGCEGFGVSTSFLTWELVELNEVIDNRLKHAINELQTRLKKA